MQQDMTSLLPPQYSAPPPPPPPPPSSPSSSNPHTLFRRNLRSNNHPYKPHLPYYSPRLLPQVQQKTQYANQFGVIATAGVATPSTLFSLNTPIANGFMNFQQPGYRGYPYNQAVAPTDAAGSSQHNDLQQVLPRRQLMSYDDLAPVMAPQQLQLQLHSHGPDHVRQRESVREHNFNCDVCNKNFDKHIQYITHMKSHRKCSQCEFSASNRVLEEHEEASHGVIKEGKHLKSKRFDGPMPGNPIILDTPEKIAAWIEERKKRWPSEANIARKQKEEQERIARGEILPNKNDRKRSRNLFDLGGRGGNNRGRFVRGGGRGGYRGGGADRPSEQEEQVASDMTVAAAAAATDGTELEAGNVNPFGLISGYGSDEDNAEEEDNQEPEAMSSKDPASVGRIVLPEEEEYDNEGRRVRRINRACKYFLKGKCARGDKCMFRHDPADRKRSSPKPAEVFRTRPTLLNMLLDKEIKQEKNVLLQCLRYIVQNKFFDDEGV